MYNPPFCQWLKYQHKTGIGVGLNAKLVFKLKPANKLAVFYKLKSN